MEMPVPGSEPLHTESSFTAGDGSLLFRQSWLPASAPRATVVLVHGYAEYSGRYRWTGEQLAAAGIAVHAYDLRGHGRSEGLRAYVGSFREHLDDLETFLGLVNTEDDGAPSFLLAHSMGGCIATLYVAVRKPSLQGLILSGPAIAAPEGAAKVLGAVAAMIAKVAPRAGVLKLSAATVSRDPAVVEAYDNDPLVFRGKMPAATLAALRRAIARIQAEMPGITLPLLLLHGTADELCSTEGSQTLFDTAASEDKTLKFYDGLAHEILNEPEKETVLGDVRGWIEARSDASAS
ncbi:hypothetical protein AYO38_03680 [bacterium SCGC AG-212-C10]|nr:hypothetical protein AYO38_03680 [bacterium SCGC AG-212-C10]